MPGKEGPGDDGRRGSDRDGTMREERNGARRGTRNVEAEGDGGEARRVRWSRGTRARPAKRWDGDVDEWYDGTIVEGFSIPFSHGILERQPRPPVVCYAKNEPYEMQTVFETSEDAPTRRT